LAFAASTSIVLLLGVGWGYFDLLRIQFDRSTARLLVWFALYAWPLAALALLVAAGTRLTLVDWKAKSEMQRRFALGFAGASSATILLPLAWLYWQMLWPTPFAPPPSSGPNKYDQLVTLAAELAGEDSRFPIYQAPANAREIADRAAPILSGPSHIPTSTLEAASMRRIGSYAEARGLMILPKCLEDAAEQAASRQDFDGATDYCLSLVRFGTVFHRGGTSSHAHFGSESERPALIWIARLRGDISPGKVRESIQFLERTLAEREPMSVFVQRDHALDERTLGWRGRLIRALSGTDWIGRADWYWVELEAGRDSVRSVQILLAIQLFEADHGRLPNDLAELSPEYLPQIPLDSYSGQPLIYRRLDSGFDLYSVGRDGIDNGGTFNLAEYYMKDGFDLDLSWSEAKSP
jgi:hypothetical protein